MESGPFAPASLEVRALRQEDLAAVCAIERSSQEHPWTRSHFEAERCNRFALIDVCVVDGIVAGFICTWLIAGELHIQNLAIAPEYRRRGIAAHLLEHVFERIGKRDPVTAWLEVRAGNQPAIALYHRFGFAVHSRRPNYYRDGEDALVMCRVATPEIDRM